jgi:hypothetical protein
MKPTNADIIVMFGDEQTRIARVHAVADHIELTLASTCEGTYLVHSECTEHETTVTRNMRITGWYSCERCFNSDSPVCYDCHNGSHFEG